MTESARTPARKPRPGLQSKEAARRTPVVVVYSGYRTSSTWFWSKLRENNQLHCYNEVFNEALSHLTPSVMATASPRDWRSRHPDGALYWLEYASLLHEANGVRGFPARLSRGGNLIGGAGIEGPLDSDVEDYLVSLIRESERKGKIPVLTCTRMLGIAAGMKARFDGLHILLVRNLFRQWVSFSGQNRFHNNYFVRMLYETIYLGDKVPFVSYISSFFSDAEKGSLECWFNEETNDRVFCYFIAFHVYFLVYARRYVDLVVDINELGSSDEVYRHAIEEKIRCRIDVQLDLSGAEDKIDYPTYRIASVEQCKLAIDVAVDRALSDLNASSDDREFALKLLSDLWREQDLFTFYTASAAEALVQATNMEKAARSHALTLEQEFDERAATAEREAQRQIVAVEHAAAESLSLAQQHLTVLKQQHSAEISILREELDATIRRADAADKSVSELVARVEVLEGELSRRGDGMRCLEAELTKARDETDVLRAEWRRLFERLELDGGPLALRVVLPLARLLRGLVGS